MLLTEKKTISRPKTTPGKTGAGSGRKTILSRRGHSSRSKNADERLPRGSRACLKLHAPLGGAMYDWSRGWAHAELFWVARTSRDVGSAEIPERLRRLNQSASISRSTTLEQ